LAIFEIFNSVLFFFSVHVYDFSLILKRIVPAVVCVEEQVWPVVLPKLLDTTSTPLLNGQTKFFLSLIDDGDRTS
jgi:hypothetical protein